MTVLRFLAYWCAASFALVAIWSALVLVCGSVAEHRRRL